MRRFVMLAVPMLVIVVALLHLATGNGPQPAAMGTLSQRTIHLVRVDDMSASTALPGPGPSWPYGAGWR